MDRRHLYFLLFLLCTIQAAIGQQRSFSIKGVVKDASSGQPIPFANVVVWNTTQGAVTDSTGLFEISGISPGSYRLQSSFLGYKPFVTAEFRLANKDIFFPIELEEASQNLQEVSVVASPFRKTAESPLGLRVIGFKEIEKSAGGNRDISRVVQTFPGVASTAAFRNDLMVRGGGPSENRFFLDGVEIPNINHFSTQGASGGPVGIINPDFIREVNFYSAAFPASKGNTLSSVLDFKLQDGNKEKFSLRGVLGASDIGVSANGPLGKKTTYQVSVRRSYLQFLFDMIGLPFLPTFTDAQFKIKHSFNPKNELTVLGLGAIDDMKLNLTYKELLEKVTIDNPQDTRILSISVEDPAPDMAKLIADKIATVSSDYIGDIMEMVPPKLIEEGEIPIQKSSPSNVKNALIGALLGAVIVCGLITVQVVMNDTIRTEEDVTKYLGLSVLASVPIREGEKPEDKEAMISSKSKTKTAPGKSRKKKGGRAS